MSKASKVRLSVEKVVECGIGLAEKSPSCGLCQDSRPGACPDHAATNVLRLLREFGYIEAGQ